MKITQENKNNVMIFKLQGSLDSNTAPDFEEKIIAEIENQALNVVVDFSEVEYISSAGLRVLNLASVKLKQSEGSLVLCSLIDYIREVFEIAGFDLFLPIKTDLDEALSSFT